MWSFGQSDSEVTVWVSLSLRAIRFSAYISGKLSVHPSYDYGQEFFDILDNEIVNTPELSPNDKKMIKKYKAAGNMMRDYIVYAIQGERTPVQAMTELKEKWSELKK